MERARFPKPPYLYPAEKGGAPLRIWAIDTITQLRPVARNGLDAVIVAICVFSKWVEAKPIQLNSLNAAKFLHEEIVCRYGMPTAVRTDQGTEFQKHFEAYCKRWGI